MTTSYRDKAFYQLGNAIINTALIGHTHEIGRQDGPERDAKVLAAFLEAVMAAQGLTGIYDYPQFMFNLANAIAGKVGCSVVEGSGP